MASWFSTALKEAQKRLANRSSHAGVAYQLRVELWPSRPDLRIKLGWIPPWVRDAKEDDEALLMRLRELTRCCFLVA